jgi:SecD/SecF fusion protein
MRYKGAIVWLTGIISALCLFFLSFTWKANAVREDAIAYATSKDGKLDPAKKLVISIHCGSNQFIWASHCKM